MTSGLNFDTILELATRETGARGLAPADLLARVQAMIGWINERGPYSPFQIDAMQRQVLQLLSTRLRLALDRQRFPAIAEEKIERPVFIIGFARSGTTLLHSLLAEDPEAQSPRSWHIYSPSPPPGARPAAASATRG